MPAHSSLAVSGISSAISSWTSQAAPVSQPTPSLSQPTSLPIPSLSLPEAVNEIEAIVKTGGFPRWWTPYDARLNDTFPPAQPIPAVPEVVDVVIVGGGYSGLMAGYELQQAGLKTLVLEAKHRIGGRSWSLQLKSGPGIAELGATWINEITQPVSYNLTKKFGLETKEQFTDGVEVYQGLDGIPVKQLPNETTTDPVSI